LIGFILSGIYIASIRRLLQTLGAICTIVEAPMKLTTLGRFKVTGKADLN
jgi:hypothetical protein